MPEKDRVRGDDFGGGRAAAIGHGTRDFFRGIGNGWSDAKE